VSAKVGSLAAERAAVVDERLVLLDSHGDGDLVLSRHEKRLVLEKCVDDGLMIETGDGWTVPKANDSWVMLLRKFVVEMDKWKATSQVEEVRGSTRLSRDTLVPRTHENSRAWQKRH
jgi:hypothetical protein